MMSMMMMMLMKALMMKIEMIMMELMIRMNAYLPDPPSEMALMSPMLSTYNVGDDDRDDDGDDGDDDHDADADDNDIVDDYHNFR